MQNFDTAGLPMSIGENIRQKREEQGLSQKRLAEAIESGENTVVGWEKDKNAPPGDKVVAMAKLFGCSTDEILMERHERDISPEMRALFRRFGDLPEDMKPMARSMISALLSSLEEEASRKRVA
ncbi:helix-turn-helix transcriptional regulator [Stutzerimonas chloritidismutans]|uniref:Helix-turn-helix transcriptional regulator n=1 Tax=Stutzerimonas chloritidismutans TaxID=203192 RepID=A0ABU9MB16_STUCH